MNETKPIVLCGFMGCGKTTVGKIIAKRTVLDFVDMDSYIEEKEGCTVREIFDKHGESYFRDLEHQACIELADRKNCIISSGGGSMIYERNVKALEKNAVIVYLSVPLEDIKYRLRNDKKTSAASATGQGRGNGAALLQARASVSRRSTICNKSGHKPHGNSRKNY